jgi:hypothetical protein
MPSSSQSGSRANRNFTHGDKFMKKLYVWALIALATFCPLSLFAEGNENLTVFLFQDYVAPHKSILLLVDDHLPVPLVTPPPRTKRP